MLSGTKRVIAVTGAAVLIIGGSAAASAMLGSDNTDMTLSMTATSYSTEILLSDQTAPAFAGTAIAAYTSSAATTEMTAAEDTISAEPFQSSDITDADIVTVYVSSSGKYHSRSDCSGMKNSTAMDITQAESEGNVPCSRCFDTLSSSQSSVQQTEATSEPIPDYGDIVYVSSTGKYHSRSDCSGMKNYTEMERSSAEAAGHEPCKKCW